MTSNTNFCGLLGHFRPKDAPAQKLSVSVKMELSMP